MRQGCLRDRRALIVAQAGLVWGLLSEPTDEQLQAFVETGQLDGTPSADTPLPYNPAVMEQLAKNWEF